ncbi:MAG: 1,4-alpha-glucan branching protein GlgB [Lachnospiraceae bacterium]|nr:1,4-alpha-glucan branching protein GlgB [Lachnospiraceae bacterium]
MNKKLYKMMDWPEIEAVVYSEEEKPHDILGGHYVSGGILIQTFIPNVKKVYAVVTYNKSTSEYPMELADEEGFYAVFIKTLKRYTYSYYFRVIDRKGKETIVRDPYCYDSIISKDDIERFNAGIHYEIYKILGAHVMEYGGVKGTNFALWAPNAIRVSVVGDFNGWDGRVHQMRKIEKGGIFELFIPGVLDGAIYKYELKLKGDNISLKADPYGYGAELRPATASVVRESTFEFDDDEWMKNRKVHQGKDRPLSVYELHLGSFRKPKDGREFYNYRELAEMIADYVKDMGYTHIELMPIMEHPLDASWGYQTLGYYAPTSRYGSYDDFKYFMNYMHNEGIGVILDWVPAHFPRDIQGLSAFDGTCLYEHLDPRQGYHPHWGTLIYNYGRPQVKNYLLANALYWIREFHADGIRMDAVASMLYLDYGKQDGEWIPNMYGGKENLEAVEFIKHLNSIHKKLDDGSLMIAEESTAWPNITGDLKDQGLGFDYKWNMGWMNDFTEYLRFDPFFRTHHYGELTFSMIYAYSERFILCFSHDEVVHGKASMLSKMPGETGDRFANLRAAYGYMLTHPGKMLSFMGQDIAEYDEWNEEREVEWDLLQYDDHRQFNDYIRDLLKLYKESPALYERDNETEGFEWINNISANENIIIFLRKSEEETYLCILNFANLVFDLHKVGVPYPGKYKEIFNSDSAKYGGKDNINRRVKFSKLSECDGRDNSITVKVAPLSLQIFRYDGEASEPIRSVKKSKTAAGTGIKAKGMSLSNKGNPKAADKRSSKTADSKIKKSDIRNNNIKRKSVKKAVRNT